MTATISDMGSRRLNGDEIIKAVLARLEDALFWLFPKGTIQGHQFRIGDIHGHPGRSLAVELEGDQRGLWHDHGDDSGGNVAALWAGNRGYGLPEQFPALLRDMAGWLGLPTAERPANPPPSIEVTGKPTGHWEYRNTEGHIIAQVRRYDTPTGKHFMPWDVAQRKHRAPDPRPLYNLPGIAQAQTVVLVEGEKCADALIALGICATTAMGGASAPISKTDWSPLAGKTVILWPDHDEPGLHYAQKLEQHLSTIVGALYRVTIPSNAPQGWDVADAVAEQRDIRALLDQAHRVAIDQPLWALERWRAATRFTGQPAPRRWLIDGVFPLAQASLVAAGGGIGKSYLLLDLARAVATPHTDGKPRFGGALSEHGVAVYLTAEDDAIEVHNRLHTLGPIPERLYVIPLPDAGGTRPLFAPDPLTRAPGMTAAWVEWEEQLRALSDLRLIVLDPLQPLCALDLNVPEHAQFVCSRLATLAAQTGAAVLVSHHFAKREVSTPEQAREAIRGTGGLVDGVRAVYALWLPKDEDGRQTCQLLGVSHHRGRVVMGGIVKANGRSNLTLSSFVRDDSGILVDCHDELERRRLLADDLVPLLRDTIARAAHLGQPYTKTGVNGVYERRHEFPQPIMGWGKHRMVEEIEQMLGNGTLVLATIKGTRLVRWLDVPDGPVAQGRAHFVDGHIARSLPGCRAG